MQFYTGAVGKKKKKCTGFFSLFCKDIQQLVLCCAAIPNAPQEPAFIPFCVFRIVIEVLIGSCIYRNRMLCKR